MIAEILSLRNKVQTSVTQALCAVTAVGLLTVVQVSDVHARALKAYDITVSANQTQVLLHLDESTSFDAFTLNNPPRLVLDLPKVKNANRVVGRSGGFVVKTRVGQHGEAYNRFVLDLSHNVILQQPVLSQGGGIHLLKIGLQASPNNEFVEQAFNHRDQTYVHRTATVLPPKPVAYHSAKPATVGVVRIPSKKPAFNPARMTRTSLPSSYGVRGSGRKPVIIIDPGHGGKDPGATSLSGVEEKDLTLTFGAELASVLMKSGQYKVYLTRNDDVYIPLRERTRLAEAVGGDLFISIHADSNTEAKARGASFYTLSDKASDKEAKVMANRENAAFLSQGEIVPHQATEVQTILNSLALRETTMNSRMLADQLALNVSQIWPTRMNPHRKAGFAVLKSRKVPAVLLEMGYLSNKLDEKILMVPGYRLTLANGIKSSIDSYFRLMDRDTVAK